jgi:hypothetical protein
MNQKAGYGKYEQLLARCKSLEPIRTATNEELMIARHLSKALKL